MSTKSNRSYIKCPMCTTINEKSNLTINCCTELKRFYKRQDCKKVVNTYCMSMIYERCPFYQSHINLIKVYGIDKVNEMIIPKNPRVGTYEVWVIENLEDDFPNIDDDFEEVFNDSILQRNVLSGKVSSRYNINKHYYGLTQKDLDDLLDLFKTEKSIDIIANRFKTTESTIRRALDYLKEFESEKYQQALRIRQMKFPNYRYEYKTEHEERINMYNEWLLDDVRLTNLKNSIFTKVRNRKRNTQSSTVRALRQTETINCKRTYMGNFKYKEIVEIYNMILNGDSFEEICSNTNRNDIVIRVLIKRILNGDFSELYNWNKETIFVHNERWLRYIIKLKESNPISYIMKTLGVGTQVQTAIRDYEKKNNIE